MHTLPSTRPDVNRESRQVRRNRERAAEKAFQARHRQYNRQFREDLEEAARRAAQREVQRKLEAYADEVTGRANGQRRNRKDKSEAEECCNKCGEHLRSRFSRKGYYPRTLGTLMGEVQLRAPRVRCICGGDVSLIYPVFLPYERQFVDVNEEMLLLSALGLSLREVQVLLDERGQQVSITTINKQVRSVADLSEEAFARLERVPPVVQLDALFIKEAEETGDTFRDKRGRLRKRKKVRKVALVVAWGIYPDTGERVLLGWVRGHEEDKEACLKLLKRLDKLGICWRTGLRLFIHDGGSGFAAAFEEVTFGEVRHQRCIFHKMRNVVDAIKGEPKMSREEKRERRREVLADLKKVWEGSSKEAVKSAMEAFAATWQEKEPEAVAKLRHEFDATLAYLDVQEEAKVQGQDWDRRFLRTTSSLERTNRTLRAKARKAGVYQTEEGLRAGSYLAAGCPGKNVRGRLQAWLPKVLDGEHAHPALVEIPCP